MKLNIVLLSLFFSTLAFAKQFEVFDGRFYNGLYYPLVDIIEWGEQNGDLPHIEFHLHSKDKPMDLTVVPGDKGGKPVLWIMYDLSFRGEKVCRHVLAPAHFTEGMKLYAYRDNSDADYDNIYVSSQPMQGKNLVEYSMQEYQPCLDENASNKPDSLPRMPASGGPATPAALTTPPASQGPTAIPAAPPAKEEKKDGKNIGADYDNHAVPFSF